MYRVYFSDILSEEVNSKTVFVSISVNGEVKKLLFFKIDWNNIKNRKYYYKKDIVCIDARLLDGIPENNINTLKEINYRLCLNKDLNRLIKNRRYMNNENA